MDPRPVLPARVELRALRCDAHVVDIGIEIDLTPVAASDAYADVVNVADLAATVSDVIRQSQRQLLETLTVDVARQVLDVYPTVRQVAVRLAKLDPLGLNAAEEAVVLTLRRSVDAGSAAPGR